MDERSVTGCWAAAAVVVESFGSEGLTVDQAVEGCHQSVPETDVPEGEHGGHPSDWCSEVVFPVPPHIKLGRPGAIVAYRFLTGGSESFFFNAAIYLIRSST